MKPFDIDAAKRGEPIQALYENTWCDVAFIGLSPDGNAPVVFNRDFHSQYSPFGERKLRMKPWKYKVYVNLYPSEGITKVGSFTAWNTADSAKAAAEGMNAIAVAVPVEIEE